MRVRLTRKLALRLDGVDVSRCRVGDCLDVSPRNAALLIAEGWAKLAERRRVDRGPMYRRRSSV